MTLWGWQLLKYIFLVNSLDDMLDYLSNILVTYIVYVSSKIVTTWKDPMGAFKTSPNWCWKILIRKFVYKYHEIYKTCNAYFRLKLHEKKFCRLKQITEKSCFLYLICSVLNHCNSEAINLYFCAYLVMQKTSIKLGIYF